MGKTSGKTVSRGTGEPLPSAAAGELVAGFPVVALGASSGGLNALETFFKNVPSENGMAFVVVVHLSPEHESHLAGLLQQHTGMPVAQVTGPVKVKPSHVYVIPPGEDLWMADGHIELSGRTRSRHAPIDLFFCTLAETHGSDVIGIILSGTGSDGAAGVGRIKELGGMTLAQSPEEAEYGEMPRNAIATGHIDRVLPVADLARELVAYRQNVDRVILTDRPDELSAEDTKALQEIFACMRSRTGHDFTHYKHTTMLRRLKRRMQVTGLEKLEAYLGILQENTDEGLHLLKDLLLTVTSFFRDPEAFDVLEKEVIPNLFLHKKPAESVRAWVCGCATGEEAYAITMLLLEQADRLPQPRSPQVFASDISESALVVAREGLYPETISADVTRERLNLHFIKKLNGYQVHKGIRERIVFANHNLLQDPPFSRLDLITCRNVLIYLKSNVHERIFELFHYALQPDGYLFLGNAESIDKPELFKAIDKKLGIYQRLPGLARIRPSLIDSVDRIKHVPISPVETLPTGNAPDLESLHQRLVVPYLPPSVIVNSDYAVLHTLGGGEAYLQFRPGKPTRNLLRIVRGELRFELRTALYKAFHTAERTRSGVIEVRIDRKPRLVELIVEPIQEQGFTDNLVMVVFREVKSSSWRLAERNRPGVSPGDGQNAPTPPETDGRTGLPLAEVVIQGLEVDRDQLRVQLSMVSQEHETAIEEIQSVNEELRSTVQELETSKEELQSVNEELQALNAELKRKIDEINGINGDLHNLINSTNIGTIFLDADLNVKRYTPRVEEIFEISQADVGRPLALLNHRLGSYDMVEDASRVLNEHVLSERKLQHVTSQRWYLVRFGPYHTVEGNAEGVVIAFVDITAQKQNEEKLEAFIETLEVVVSVRSDQVKQLGSELILAEQSERQRIAQILHDDLQQLLHALQMRVELLCRSLSKEQSDRLIQSKKLISRALEVTRTLMVEINPPVLKGDDFTVAIDWLAIQMEEMHGLKVDTEMAGPIRLPVDLRVLLFQIVRELLFNVVKHAGSDRARLKTAQERDHIVLCVEDDGSGFDTAEGQDHLPSKRGGFGLRSVRQRLDLFGGQVNIRSAPGQGTQVTLFVPLVSGVSGTEVIETHETALNSGV